LLDDFREGRRGGAPPDRIVEEAVFASAAPVLVHNIEEGPLQLGRFKENAR
jgi:hypothetical protein